MLTMTTKTIRNEAAEAADHANVKADVDSEEAEEDLQLAHSAEALEVIAGIELQVALAQEAFQVEKVEELAMEEALTLLGK